MYNVAFVVVVFALWAPLHSVNEGEERESKVTLPCSGVNVTEILAPYPFTTHFTLMLVWGGANGFDADTSSTQNMRFPYAFNSDWGDHCCIACAVAV